MPDRSTRIARFIEAHGWDGATRRPLAGDASFRRYDRLTLDGRRAVLMDAPPPQENVRPFLTLARHLRALGFSAPEILAADEDAGLLLLEDLGDDTYTKVLAKGGDEHALYGLAVDVLIDLHARPQQDAIPPGLPPYGNGRLLDEAFLLPQWTMPEIFGEAPDEGVRRAYGDAWLELFPQVHVLPKTLVLRDYHVDNLIWLKERDGIRACGLLDFQDAVSGCPAYDLMSLLEDARRDIAPPLKAAMLARYFAGAPDIDRETFMTAFAILSAQRHAKVIGIFTRLSLRDGKSAYLAHLPRVWGLLEGALAHPALTPVKAWFDRHIPESVRGVPSMGSRVS
ncbi:MAG: phosphotransferase [Rhodospirillales bacterium]|nr:phosphotransferase [Rhodospirillales bacterium]